MNQLPLVAARSTIWRVNHPELKTTERALSITAGSLLLFTALRRGGVVGLLGAATGAYCVFSRRHRALRDKAQPGPDPV
ncbi:hypothetical protein [Pseudomonas viridiflava]|uniref:hypothetical protein n=1 Tax=Pseudomonas viridiflava TaxID=33069 RepID=UPI000F041DC8|nr:hypothetical protein [Pseudomonas viridiflava]